MVVRNDINRKQLISLVFHMNGNEKTLELSTDFLEKSDVGGNGTIIKGLVEYVRQKYRVSNNETIDVIVKPTCIKIGNESLKKPAIMKKNHFRASQLNSGSDEQGYYSKECNLRYENKHNFEAHLETHESVNQLSVEEFDKRITDQSALGKDFETPNNETIDGEKYKNITDGEAHDKSLKKRNIKKTVYCETCNKSISKNFYRYHMKNFHLGLKEHACDICGRSFAQKGAMMEHKRIHTEERPFICDICGHGFALKKSMVDHRRVHTGEMPFICDICGRCFAQRGSMREHRRIHTGERPFICQVCGKAVRTFSILFKHLKLHSDERPYSCQTCHKTFKYSNSLVRHNVTHTGEKNYVCELCGKRFGSSSELRVHKSAHSGLNLFPCPKCNLTFKFRDSLRKHIRRKHFLESKTALTLVQNIASNETKHILIDNFINQQHNPVDETVEAPNVLQNIEATMNETDEPLEFDKIHQT